MDRSKSSTYSAKIVTVQIAPSVRVALGELFGLAPGTVITNKIFAALRKLGFDKVYDTLFARMSPSWKKQMSCWNE